MKAGQPSGFLWAYVVRDGVAEQLSEANLAAARDEETAWTWLHFPLSDQRARAFIDHIPAMPEAARRLILDAEERVQLQCAGDWAYGVVPDLERDLEGEPVDVGRLLFAFDGHQLITARRHSLWIVDKLRREAGAGALRLASPADAFVKLIERFIDVSEARLHTLAEGLDSIEDRLLAEGHELDAAGLGPHRRELSRQHREFLALRCALYRATSPREPHQVVAVADQLPRLTQEIEDLDREAISLQDRARLLYEEIDSRVTAATNRNMRALTIMSTLLIPPTLIVGAFGMNLPGMPFSHSGGGFGAASLLCVAVMGGIWVLLRRMKIVP